jgi:hypothetical protein
MAGGRKRDGNKREAAKKDFDPPRMSCVHASKSYGKDTGGELKLRSDE